MSDALAIPNDPDLFFSAVENIEFYAKLVVFSSTIKCDLAKIIYTIANEFCIFFLFCFVSYRFLLVLSYFLNWMVHTTHKHKKLGYKCKSIGIYMGLN